MGKFAITLQLFFTSAIGRADTRGEDKLRDRVNLI